MDNDKIDLVKLMKKRQLSLELNMNEFAKYIGVSRQWLCKIYSKTQKKQYIRYDIMIKMANRLNIPLSVIEQYNMDIILQRELEKK